MDLPLFSLFLAFAATLDLSNTRYNVINLDAASHGNRGNGETHLKAFGLEVEPALLSLSLRTGFCFFALRGLNPFAHFRQQCFFPVIGQASFSLIKGTKSRTHCGVEGIAEASGSGPNL